MVSGQMVKSILFISGLNVEREMSVDVGVTTAPVCFGECDRILLRLHTSSFSLILSNHLMSLCNERPQYDVVMFQ